MLRDIPTRMQRRPANLSLPYNTVTASNVIKKKRNILCGNREICLEETSFEDSGARNDLEW